MANKFRNEMVVKVGGVEILLRPTFENCANLESALGYGLPVLSFILYQASKDIKKMPVMTDIAKIIFFCQAEKTYTLEQIWDFMMGEGAELTLQALTFVAKITAGDKTQVEVKSEELKKNT